MRYTPSWYAPPAHGGWRRLAVWACVAAALVLAIITVWPLFYHDDIVGRSLRDARAFVWEGLFYAALAPFTLGLVFLILVPLPVYLVLKRLSPLTAERLLETCLRLSTGFTMIATPIALCVVLIAGAVLWVWAPTTKTLAFEHVKLAHVTVSPLIRNLGPYTLERPHATLAGNYLALDTNVISLASSPPRTVFSAPIDPISDIRERNATLILVTGRNLIQVGDSWVKKLARLPFPRMRLGVIALPGGQATLLLLAGNDGAHGYVFKLDGDGNYEKLLDVDAPVTGVAGCLDKTAVALSDRVLLLRQGFRPRLLFRLPNGAKPVTSVLGHAVMNDMVRSCLWLVATGNGVFGIQDGLATLLIAGIGGNLADPGDTFASRIAKSIDFVVTDNRRNTAVDVSLEGGGDASR